MSRQRLDQLLVDRGLVESRALAQKLVRAGLVRTQGRTLDQPAKLLDPETPLEVVGREHPFVGRGGMKLAAALDAFELDPTGAVGLDIGASTGGFTDCLLQRGAIRVHAVDVGKAQLDWRLRSDPRVRVYEELNARSLEPAMLGEPVDALVVDVSFISAKLVLGPGILAMRPGAWGVTLVKPQFEAGRDQVGKGGIVRDEGVRVACVTEVSRFLEGLGCDTLGSIESPILGAKGNHEHLVAFRKRHATS